MQDKTPPDQKKRCTACNKIKSLKSFGINRQNKDGYHYRCKLCMNARNKMMRDAKKTTDLSHLRLTNVGLKDYVKAYQLLREIGYDINKPIHKQFCSKHKLEYKKRIKKSRNAYTKKVILKALLDTF